MHSHSEPLVSTIAASLPLTARPLACRLPSLQSLATGGSGNESSQSLQGTLSAKSLGSLPQPPAKQVSFVQSTVICSGVWATKHTFMLRALMTWPSYAAGPVCSSGVQHA